MYTLIDQQSFRDAYHKYLWGGLRWFVVIQNHNACSSFVGTPVKVTTRVILPYNPNLTPPPRSFTSTFVGLFVYATSNKVVIVATFCFSAILSAQPPRLKIASVTTITLQRTTFLMTSLVLLYLVIQLLIMAQYCIQQKIKVKRLYRSGYHVTGT